MYMYCKVSRDDGIVWDKLSFLNEALCYMYIKRARNSSYGLLVTCIYTCVLTCLCFIHVCVCVCVCYLFVVGISLWELEVDRSSRYNAMQTNFHTFSVSGKTYAIQFAK